MTGQGFNGIAPDAGLVGVKAFDDDGRGSYANVIRGLDWIYQNRDVYDIRVVNLSFSAEPRSYYWDDPLNQAVMALWEAGIVVVASAGNRGPDAMTIGVPGNVPYVITVGAMSDNCTPGDGSDDFLASFSSAGPTVEGFVKPEVVAPGGHMLGVVDPIALHPEPAPGVARRRLLHHVGHLAGGGGGQRRRGADAAGGPVADPRRRQVPADGLGAAGGRRTTSSPTASSSRAPA